MLYFSLEQASLVIFPAARWPVFRSRKRNRTKQHTIVTKEDTLSKQNTNKKIEQLFSRELKVMLHGKIRNDDFSATQRLQWWNNVVTI